MGMGGGPGKLSKVYLAPSLGKIDRARQVDAGKLSRDVNYNARVYFEGKLTTKCYGLSAEAIAVMAPTLNGELYVTPRKASQPTKEKIVRRNVRFNSTKALDRLANGEEID